MDTEIPTWLKKPQPLFIGGSLIAAIIAVLAEGTGNVVGLLLLGTCVAVICGWAVTGKPTLVWAVVVMAIAMIAMGWTVKSPEAAMFQPVLLAAAVGWKVSRKQTSIFLILCLVAIPIVSVIGPFAAEWGWWNWVIGISLSWTFGRLIRLLDATLNELSVARELLIELGVKEERMRMSRDIHDLVGHSLTAMLLNVRAAIHNLDINLMHSRNALNDAEKIGVTGLEDIRSAISGLREDALSESADSAQLKSLPDGESVQLLLDRQTHLTIKSSGDMQRLQGALGVAIYRTLQECITNITRHSADGRGNLELNIGPNDVELTADNAINAKLESVPLSDNTLGLVSMRERVTGQGGKFTTRVDQGRWFLHCRLPINV